NHAFETNTRFITLFISIVLQSLHRYGGPIDVKLDKRMMIKRNCDDGKLRRKVWEKAINHVSSCTWKLWMLIVVVMGGTACSNTRTGPPRVLVFSKTAAFYHQSIPAGNKALMELGEEHGFEVDTTTNAEWFNEDSLKNYSAVVFLSTTGDVLNHQQEVAFERYIQAGGGYVGIHAASDCEYD